MAKKYLGLEEAAQLAGIPVDELNQLREARKIRGFADRGTWKFKGEDIEELKRSLEFDSNPDVPMIPDDDIDTADQVAMDDEIETRDHALTGDDDAIGEMPTEIRTSVHDDEPLPMTTSDSDVRLIVDDDLATIEGGSDLLVGLDDSDSDVKLVDSSPDLLRADSDVSLIDGGTDSDVRLVDGDSDSDVQLVNIDDDDDSDSDVKLVDGDSDSDVQLVNMGDDDLTHDISAEELANTVASEADGPASGIHSSVFEEDADINMGEGSSIKLSSESGISLESLDSDIQPDGFDSDLDDSGIALEPSFDDDSGLTLEAADDSGITLDGFDDDSGLSFLEDDDDALVTLDAEGSGIDLGNPADSGIALELIDDSGIAIEEAGPRAGSTVPMMAAPDFNDTDETAMDVPVLSDDSEYELALDDAGTDDNVISFDDDDSIDEFGATVVNPGASSEEFDLTGDDEFDMEQSDESFEGDDEFGDFDEDLVGAEADLGGEDDFFEEEDEAFDEGFATGESQGDFAAAGAMAALPAEAAPPADWGIAPFIGLFLSTGLLAVCGIMMFDLVRSMWSWSEPAGFSSTFLDMFKDLL